MLSAIHPGASQPDHRRPSHEPEPSVLAVPGRVGFVFNLRTLSATQSGVQRYARELDSRFGPHATRLVPTRMGQGCFGHLWEQLILPARCRGRLLFSPGNTGPLFYARQVVTIHDASTFDQSEAFTGIFGRWYRWLLPRLARRARGVITVSQFSRDRLSVTLGLPVERIAVVYNGVTEPPPPMAAAALAGIRARLSLPDKFLLCVGSHDPRKNIGRLLTAFAKSGLEDFTLVLAGGSNPRLFRAGATEAVPPRVRVLGPVDNPTLEVLYALTEGFVFPSLYEGFGLPPLEAMARGCPVLCSDSSSLPEVCGPSLAAGGACLYFDPQQTDSIVEALQAFARLDAASRARMVAAGRRQAARFSWDRCALETATALDRFARQAGSRPDPMPTACAPASLKNTP